MEIITKTLNEIMNAKRAGKVELTVKPISKLLLQVLDIMKERDYIEYKINKEGFGSVTIKIKRLNECRSITPRFYTKIDEFDKYVRRFLPAREFGMIIVSTDRGLMTHYDALDKKTGGSLLAYCF
ncbi:MAG: 30S ribosomal protein S8 [Nanoarchaeota archaeon]|nr:30S ribosomal protein S8 [Nanoarchaeota archaeon]